MHFSKHRKQYIIIYRTLCPFRPLQVKADNYKGGKDIISNQFDFQGKVLSSYQVHNNESAGITNLTVQTMMEYDHAGRLLHIKKKVNDDAATQRMIVVNEYDALGQLKRNGNWERSAPAMAA